MTNKRAAEVLSMAVTFNGCGRCTGDEMREAVKMACATLEATEWISVNDRLPEWEIPPKDVLVYHDLGCGMFVDRAWYSYDKHTWMSALGTRLKVTHWMPLPQPPKEDA